MFKTLSGLTDNAFWRVSADTKTCGSPLYLSPPTGKGASYWRFMLAFWLTYVYFNVFSNNVNKKMNKKALFLAAENAEIFLDRIDTVFLDTD